MLEDYRVGDKILARIQRAGGTLELPLILEETTS